MKYLIFLLLASSIAFGQNTEDTEYAGGIIKFSGSDPSSPKNNRVQSDTIVFNQKGVSTDYSIAWKLLFKDDSTFKFKNFNDEKWKTIDLSISYNDLPELKKNTVGWFRKSMYVDPSAVGVPLVFYFKEAGAYEFFVDGKPVYSSGEIAGSKSKTLVNEKSTRVSYLFKEGGTHQFAVRFLFDVNAKINKGANINPLHIDIYEANKYSLNDPKLGLDQTIGIVVGLFLLAAAIHWFFFFHFKSDQRDTFNAYFAASMLLFAIYNYITTFSVVNYQLDWFVFQHSLKNITFIAGHCMLLLAVNNYLYKKNNVIIYVTSALAIALTIATNFFDTEKLTRQLFSAVIVILFVAVYIYLALTAKKQQIKSAKTLLKAVKYFLLAFFASVGCLLILGFVEGATDTNLADNIAIVISVMLILLLAGPQLAVSFAISADLAREFVRTNVSLNDKIGEIEKLSVEKQEILSQQNEVLETQVRERTSALNESITDLKSTQAQLIQSEKLASLGELTAGIAHEIQNPLNFVNNFSEVSEELVDEVLEERNKDKTERDEELEAELLEDLKQNLGKIQHHGKRASGIVRSMLEHSRMSTGEKAMTDINALADEYLRLAYHGLRAKDRTFNAKIETHFDETLPKINVVSQDIGRVLLNIINNAFQAPPPKNAPADYMKQLTVSTHKIGDWLQITIKDNGSGISDENRKKIFQPFFTTKKTGEGTGLGLSLAYDIITKGHGGSIDVVTKQNEGTEFLIELPL